MRILGIDIGGTFTDLYLLDTDTGTASIHKVSTTPENPAKGAVSGIQELLERCAVSPASVDYILHGTTIGTNAVLKHEGARTGMITTENYRDVIHIGRHQRPQNYSIQQDIPWQARPLVERRYRKTVPERLVPPDGAVEVPLDEDAVRRVAKELGEAGVEAVAVCYLFSYLNDEHERRTKELVKEVLPEAYVTTSAEVYRQFREFERFTTACMNAFIGPEVTRYLELFRKDLNELGLETDLHVMKSNGGVGTERMVKEKAVSLLYSGPAAGVLGGRWRSSLYAQDEALNAITLDMGGTSADIGIVSRGEMAEANVRETQIGGYPIMIPMLDIETIGAGGGSIAYLDPGGAFRVGPKSAGADPGPACYDRGGTRPTVTDAHVVLGRVRPEFFLGGKMALAPDRAWDSVKQHLADPLQIGVLEAAFGVLRIVNSNMANAIRTKTIQKGRDPKRFTLVAFGGAGPMHGAALARELDITRVLIPVSPGVLSAAGLSTTDIQYDFITTEFSVTDRADADSVEARYRDLREQASEQLRSDGFSDEDIRFELTADCRYVGQGYELNIPVGDDGVLFDLETLRKNFDQVHLLEFGHNFPSNPVELVNERVTGFGKMPSPKAIHIPEAETPVEEHVLLVEKVGFSNEAGKPELFPTRFFERTALRAGHALEGPAIVVDQDSTIVIPPDFQARVLEFGDLELTRVH